LPLASLDTGGHIIYVGSFCKSIAPGIRIGFMVAPEVVINEAAAIRRLIDRQGEQLLEEATAELLSAGEFPGTSKSRTWFIKGGWKILADCFMSSWENI
jgi:DNA-binding transcriptional MocR family regulator